MVQSKKETSEKRKIIRRLSNDGGWIIEVPVDDTPKPQVAVFLANDWGDMMSKGLYPILRIDSKGYLNAWSPEYKKFTRVARLVVNAPSDHDVEMIDGNELNCRSTNIRLMPPPPPKPVTRARDNFLSPTPVLQPFNDVVEWETINDVGPVFKRDPLAEAYLNNPRIVEWHIKQIEGVNLK